VQDVHADVEPQVNKSAGELLFVRQVESEPLLVYLCQAEGGHEAREENGDLAELIVSGNTRGLDGDI